MQWPGTPKVLLIVITLYIGILAVFGNFWPNFCLIPSSCWFYNHFFALHQGTQIYCFCETQMYVEILNNT